MTTPVPKWKSGDRVQFAHVPASSARIYEIQKVSRDGMVTVDQLRGEFAPHVFIAAVPLRRQGAERNR